MVVRKKLSLVDIFKNLQLEMEAALYSGKKNIQHPGIKGSVTEAKWLDWLNKYLPKRYTADSAFVLDSKGNISDQIDLVIYDRHFSPVLMNSSGAIYLPAESIYAVFEIKQTLNKSNLLYAAKKIESVRKLIRTSAEISYAEGKYKPKPLFRILGGLLTLESEWNNLSRDVLKSHLNRLKLNQQIDLICSLQNCSINCTYKDREIQDVIIGQSKQSLLKFFFDLIGRLQTVASVPAIDYRQYLRVFVNQDIDIPTKKI